MIQACLELGVGGNWVSTLPTAKGVLHVKSSSLGSFSFPPPLSSGLGATGDGGFLNDDYGVLSTYHMSVLAWCSTVMPMCIYISVPLRSKKLSTREDKSSHN